MLLQMVNFYDITLIDYFFQLINFLPFLFFLNFKKFSETNFELLLFFTILFSDDEDELSGISFFNFYSKNYTYFERFFYHELNFNSKLDEFFSCGTFLNSKQSDEITECLPFTEFFSADYSFNLEFFDYLIFSLVCLTSVYFFSEIADEESSGILNFIQFSMGLLSTTDDLFILFLGFELLTIAVVLSILLNQEKYVYSRAIILYFVLSVSVSLTLFFFCFFIILVCTNSTLFSFFNISNFFFDLVVLFETYTDVLVLQNYSFCLKFFLLNILVLFMFKFTVGPVALWTIYIYPTFPMFMLLFQMVFVKYNLYFLFLEIFDFVFLFDFSVIDFYLKIFTFLLLISMFVGCFAYKINDLKTIFIVTTFSQIAYIAVGFMNSSFLILVYSLNYFLLYLYSTFILFLILLIANTVYNIQHIQELGLMRYTDFGLYLSLVFIIFSMSGLPPFLGFFVKYFLLIKILTTPLLFKFGLVLLITSFITMYVYLSVVFNLIKATRTLNYVTVYHTTSRYHLPGQFSITFIECVSFVFSGFLYLFILFLLSPFFFILVPETDDFLEFFYEWNFLKLADLLEYYFAD